MWKLVSVRLEIVLISTHDRCTVCVECTSAMEIILGTPQLLAKVGQEEAHFDPFGDSVILGAG